MNKLEKIEEYRGCTIEAVRHYVNEGPEYIVTDIDGVSEGGFATLASAHEWIDEHPSRRAA